MMPNYNKYNLIGICDFSHGDTNIWEYRLKLLKYFAQKYYKDCKGIFILGNRILTKKIMKKLTIINIMIH
jgi:hypothetical protein